jgi:hypothetical protein
MVGTEQRTEAELDAARRVMVETLNARFGQGCRPDFNNVGQQAIADRLREPFQRADVSLTEEQLQGLAGAMRGFRDTPPRSGLLRSFDELAQVPGVTPAVMTVLKDQLSLVPFSIRCVEVVGPKIGE